LSTLADLLKTFGPYSITDITSSIFTVIGNVISDLFQIIINAFTTPSVFSTTVPVAISTPVNLGTGQLPYQPPTSFGGSFQW